MENGKSDKLLQEFREQVNDLLAATQLLTSLVREQGSQRDMECLAAMNRSLYQLMRTIFHMELCREEAPSFRPELVDLAGLCRDLGHQVEPLAEVLGISFRWELERENIFSLADEVLLEQALLNLLTNAFAAAGQEGHVTLRCSSHAGRCILTVGDNGPGLSPQEASEDPLLKQPGGVGLGLEAARRAVSLHGGALVLENREEGGVRAVISLPIREPEGGFTVKSSQMFYDRTGGFSPLLVEFSPLLPLQSFMPEDVE